MVLARNRSFWFWREIVFGVTYRLSVQYSYTVMSVFLLWRESFITTEKRSSSRLSGGLCFCVSFGFWREIGSFFVVLGKFYYDLKKKVLVVCLAGCAVVSVLGSGGK